MSDKDIVRELLAELDAGETMENVILHALDRGRVYGYNKGMQVGYLQSCDEFEWQREAIKRGQRI
jgi:hypothetical protein